MQKNLYEMVSIYTIRLLLLITICTVFRVCAQDAQFVKCSLYGSDNNAPLVFSTIRIKGKSVGVISNEDGSFRIPRNYWIQKDTIVITHIGYQKKVLPLAILKPDSVNKIFLVPDIFVLSEVELVSTGKKAASAGQIVSYAIENIPRNTLGEDFALVGYYRDYQTKESEYINLNEALIEVRDKGFNNRNNYDSNFLLYEYTRNQNFKVDTFASRPYDYRQGNKVIPSATMVNTGGNEVLTLIIHDAIRNYKEDTYSFINNMAEEFTKTHKFKIARNTYIDGLPVYDISIRYRKNGYLAKGKIVIDEKNYAIHKLDYSLYIQKMMNPINRFKDDNDSPTEEDPDKGLVYRIITEYRRGEDQKMFLNYISFRNKFIVKRPPEFKVTKFVIDLDDKCFRLTLNREPINPEKVKIRDFVFSYKDRQLPIEKVEFKKDSLQFLVYPDSTQNAFKHHIRELFTQNDSLRIRNFEYEFLNIRDSTGNILNEYNSENMQQYREFFVQEVKLDPGSAPDISTLMNKNLPLFSHLQPFYAIKGKHRYWMNTPLKSINN